jgi:hypothetical protein
MTKVHIAAEVEPLMALTVCGYVVAPADTTTAADEVTCKTCLKMADKRDNWVKHYG